MPIPSTISTRPGADDDGRCQIDNTPLRIHPRCANCSILIGPGHAESVAVKRGGKTYCHGCVKERRV